MTKILDRLIEFDRLGTLAHGIYVDFMMTLENSNVKFQDVKYLTDSSNKNLFLLAKNPNNQESLDEFYKKSQMKIFEIDKNEGKSLIIPIDILYIKSKLLENIGIPKLASQNVYEFVNNTKKYDSKKYELISKIIDNFNFDEYLTEDKILSILDKDNTIESDLITILDEKVELEKTKFNGRRKNYIYDIDNSIETRGL